MMKWQVRRKAQRIHREEAKRIERLQLNRFVIDHNVKHEYGQRPQNRRPTQITVWFKTSEGAPFVVSGNFDSSSRAVYLGRPIPSYVAFIDRIDFEFDDK